MKGEILLKGARENNLKSIDISIPWHKYTVITGLSGSGKSSLALDTIYAEGLRRYVESLSTYARQFLERVEKPEFDDISGLPPAIAIESVNTVRNSRSTVGTSTEIYDYLRLLFSKVGKIVCPNCNEAVIKHSPQAIADSVLGNYCGARAIITCLLHSHDVSSEILLSKGFTRVYECGEILDLEEIEDLSDEPEIVLDRIVLDRESRSRLIDSLEVGFSESDYILVHILEGDTVRFSCNLECNSCGLKFDEPTPILFSFNNPHGACQSCKGFGNILEVDPGLIVPDKDKSLSKGAIEPLTKPSNMRFMYKLLKFAEEQGIDITKPYKSLTSDELSLIYNGGGNFRGIKGFFKYLEEKSYKMHVRVFLSKYRSAFTCSECKGSRLRKEALWIRINDKNISQLTDISIAELKRFFEKIKLTRYEKEISEEILKQINSRIEFLLQVGLEYVSLSRLTRTLSGGEAQRVNLACQLGSRLTETLYVLDEPSVGLHPRDIDRLISLLKELRDRDNTVLVVEHDFSMIKASDHIIELGPGAGESGGEVVYQGTTKTFLRNGIESITKSYIKEKEKIPLPSIRRNGNGKRITVKCAEENNLKKIDVKFPLNTLICVTGVSGSGKSSLVNDILYSALARKFRSDIERVGKYKEIKGFENISDIILLDQSPIGRSSRSNPVTYIKVYDEIRNVMAGTWISKANGFKPSHYSFNVSGGRCEKCQGEGTQKVDMHFLADVFVTCDECKGRRFKSEILKVEYKGKNIDQILSMTVTQGLSFFSASPKISRKLKVLCDVGLGYLRLGQQSTTLSGGEAQRIKIARELSRKDGRNILYILDEPSVGLHADDVKKLLDVVNKLVESGNTAIIVEHNLDIIKSADYIIDLGPEGGEKGGYIVAEGKPEEIVRVKESYTGKYLSRVL